MLRLIFMDKHSAMSAEETSLDSKTILFTAWSALLARHKQKWLISEGGRVAPNLCLP